MRFQRLDLIKYGKFADRSVEFPLAEQDFHLIVGPNEAGKSTLRAAIVDLLFGIPARSVHGFLHPLNELRLGAIIGNAADTLEFQRAKAQKQTLRTPEDVVLPDMTLAAFLGTADRNFYDQMFGLDHNRLVSGGNSILNAENDVGQILFQSAVGVASLGKIRDALEAEADKLWAPKKSAGRDYYIAAEQLDKATAALKDATVRTKAWVEANHKVEALQESLASERRLHQQLQHRRNSLERIRRLAPFLVAIRETERKLADLGAVIELPKEAAATLSTAERELAVAEQRLALRSDESDKTAQALEKIQVDETLLGLAADIAKLDKLRLQYSAYERDIGHRKKEIAVFWQEVCDLCAQLGWTAESAAAITQRLPSQLVQRELRELIRQQGRISQALRSAEVAEGLKETEIETLATQLADLQSGEIKPALRAALAHANSFGDAKAIVQKQQHALGRAESALENLAQELGQWRKPLAVLLAMQPPSQEMISRLLQQRQALIAEQKSESIRLRNQKTEVGRIELQIAQFKELHHPITYENVLLSRQERDASWFAIKAAETDLQQAAERFEALVSQADKVADLRTDDVEEETALRTLQHQLERERQSLAVIGAHCSKLDREIEFFDEDWAMQAAELNLSNLPLDEAGAWLIKLEKLRAAASAAQEVRNEFDLTCRLLAEARSNLLATLKDAGLKVSDEERLSVLCIEAESFIQRIDGANVRRETLAAQLQAAKTLLTTLKQATKDAVAEKSAWTAAWSNALIKAGLAADSDISHIEGTLEIIAQMAEKLAKMRQIQVERIDTMNADLQGFSVEAVRLSQMVRLELETAPPDQIALELANRLTQARESSAERERLRESLRRLNSQVLEARESIKTATASLKPLMERAGVDSNQSLAEAIVRSDAHRLLNAEWLEASNQLLNGGDGLTRLQIESEIDSADLLQLAADLATINDELADAVQRQTDISAQLANASSLLAEIGDSDAAALAEAQRQEALSKMSDVAERYVKVFTAERLLRWSIDRYREEKQGPLLQRAGCIFSTLTSGSFQKLVIDFKGEALVLDGLRSDGKLVGISGMSDGSRDQLYLALRLAALEIHLEQAMPLPFIADDLFINYDDVRSKAGFEALRELSERTQVIFLSHHDHLISSVQEVFGKRLNVVYL